MGPFKTKYAQAVDGYLRRNPGKVVTVYEVAGLSSEAFLAVATMENALAGFRSTGIFPYDRRLFADTDFAAADFLNTSNRTADKNVQTDVFDCVHNSAAEVCTYSHMCVTSY